VSSSLGATFTFKSTVFFSSLLVLEGTNIDYVGLCIYYKIYIHSFPSISNSEVIQGGSQSRLLTFSCFCPAFTHFCIFSHWFSLLKHPFLPLSRSHQAVLDSKSWNKVHLNYWYTTIILSLIVFSFTHCLLHTDLYLHSTTGSCRKRLCLAYSIFFQRTLNVCQCFHLVCDLSN
jgi:hypothetical protein